MPVHPTFIPSVIFLGTHALVHLGEVVEAQLGRVHTLYVPTGLNFKTVILHCFEVSHFLVILI